MSRLQNRIRQIICTGKDEIDWSRTFDVIDILNKSPKYDNDIFQTIANTASSGDKLTRMNCVRLVDSFFKNCNQGVISRLISNPIVLSLSDDFFTRDPRLHKMLCGLSAEWMKIAMNNHVLTQQFTNWQKDLCNYRYEYVMTDKIAKKFTTELTACLELLQMFNQAMQQAMQNHAPPNDPLLNEILPNIHEIHVRIKELKPTINDKYVLDVLSYIEEYCQACKIAFSDFTQVGECDLEGLQRLAAKGIPKRGGASAPVPAPAQPAPPAPAPAPAPQAGAPPSYPDLSVISQPQQANDLLDFGSPQPMPAPAPAAAPQPAAGVVPPGGFAPPQPMFTPPQQQQQQVQQPYGAQSSNPMGAYQPPQPQPIPQAQPQQVPSYQPPQPQANNDLLFQPPQAQYQPPMQQGYSPNAPAPQQPAQPTSNNDDDGDGDDDFMNFLENISTKK